LDLIRDGFHFPTSTGTVAPELQTCTEPRFKIARRFEIQLPTERNAVKKLFLLAASASLLLAGAASAADMAARPYTKAPVAPVAVYNWTGFYVGVNGGGGWAHKCWDLISVAAGPRPVAEGCHDATGGTVGGQIGYRWQSAAWVFGVEAQGNWADFRGSNLSNNLTFATPYTNRTRVDAFGLFTGQIGYA